ncbi:unnamed protein product [Aphanomyces euteiches]|uniref:FYVE-type domain-containing protein n=1 Tax=Aphanomyces euteiches TaxID=100861 RepID=A0A6G0WGF4_9STRA|nr:hypothetical protein Ae201684_015504 [Aphanomyces euteiches]KAH9153126.1 hypothetical protein AeRB84_004547 [Aphanomyces euteiches]
MKLPLPRDFFSCPPLSPKDIACLHEAGRQAALDIVQLTQDRNAIHWQAVSQSNQHVRIYRGQDPTKPPTVLTWCGMTQLQASIDEVADLFRAETTEQYQDYCRMFTRELLDGATLYTLALPTRSFPRHYVGVKWHAVETAFFVQNRDFLNLEGQYDVEFEGRRGWVRVFRGVHLTCCPDISKVLNLTRGHHYATGHVFFETDKPGYLNHTQLLHGDFGTNAPDFAVVIGMKKRLRQMLDFRRFLCERRLAKTPFMDVSLYVPKGEQYQCSLCRRNFGLFRSKEHCRKCGQVVCSHCVKSWEIPLHHKFTMVPICTRCTHHAVQVDDAWEISSLVSTVVRPIVLSGAMLFAPPVANVGSLPLDKFGTHRVLQCDCEKQSKTTHTYEDE